MKKVGSQELPAHLLCILLLFGLFFQSCNLFSASDEPLPDPDLSNGASLVRYGARLYVLGGKDNSGSPLSTVRSATIANDGSAFPLEADAPLPEGLMYGSAVAGMTFIYMLGGETEGGALSSAVRFTLINDDGKLGFSSGEWETNLRPLPEPRSRAASVLHDGWVYLIGGVQGKNRQTV